MPEIFKAKLPEFVSVTVCGELVVPIRFLPKFRLEVDKVTIGANPVPVSPAVCGLFEALSVTVSEAVRLPVAVGVKVTLIVQLAPAARLLPQLLVWPKSPLLAPVTAMLVIPSAVAWGLLSVTD